MSLVAQIPGGELYTAILDAFHGSVDLNRDGVPIILEGPILFQGEVSAWNGHDAIVVVSETTNDFSIVTNKVNIISPGALYYRNSREILSYIQLKGLAQKNLTINIQGIFSEDAVRANQLPLEASGLNAFVTLGVGLPFVSEARVVVLRKKIKDIDRINRTKGPSVTHAEAKRHERDSALSGLLKELRGYKCQICGYTFETATGELYCECHHLEYLAHQGLDVSKNMLVVCANCHRQMHYGKVRILEHDDLHVVVELDGMAHTCSL